MDLRTLVFGGGWLCDAFFWSEVGGASVPSWRGRFSGRFGGATSWVGTNFSGSPSNSRLRSSMAAAGAGVQIRDELATQRDAAFGFRMTCALGHELATARRAADRYTGKLKG